MDLASASLYHNTAHRGQPESKTADVHHLHVVPDLNRTCGPMTNESCLERCKQTVWNFTACTQFSVPRVTWSLQGSLTRGFISSIQKHSIVVEAIVGHRKL